MPVEVRVSLAEENRGLLDAPPAAKANKVSALSSWRRLWEEARDVRPALAVGCVFLVLSSASFNGLPYLAGKLLDAVTGVDNGAAARRHLNSVALQLSLLALISGALSGTRMLIFNSASERVVAHIRARLFKALLRQDLMFYDSNVTGSLLSRITADTELLRDAATTNVSILLRSSANALIGIGMMLWVSWQLTLLALAVTPAVVLFVAHFGRALRQLSKETRTAAAEASSLAGDTLGAIRTVKAFAREHAEASFFEVSVQKTLQLGLTTARRGALFMACATSVMVIVIATVFWYGGLLVLSGRMTVGSLQAFVLYAVAIAGAIGGLSGVVVSLMTAVGASARVFELLDRVPALAPSGALRPFDGRQSISAELRGVWFAYPSRPDVWVLRGIDILVEEGQTFALCGTSGCGKSTIAALIERFYDPQKGTVFLAGVPAPDIDTVHLHRALGIVSQEPLLLARSIRENIAFGVDNATDEEIAAAAAAANAASFIEQYDTKYDTQVGERGVQLSGGQKQRIAIARALLAKPLMLLLDEATSALDAESEAAVVDALERARKGRTALVIAHRLSTVRDADCIAVIGSGAVKERGTHDALLAQGGTYARLVQRQLATADSLNTLAETPEEVSTATTATTVAPYDI